LIIGWLEPDRRIRKPDLMSQREVAESLTAAPRSKS